MRTKIGLLLLLTFLLAGCSDGSSLTIPGRIAFDDLVDDTVSLSMSERTPLAAEATFRTTEAVTVQVEVLGDEPLSHTFAGSETDHVIPILGLYPDRENRVVLTLTTEEGAEASDTISVETEPLPDFFPDVEITVATSEMEPGWTVSSFGLGDGAGRIFAYPFAFDSQGQIRWYLDLSDFDRYTFHIERLRNGNLLFGQAGAVYEYDMLGQELNRWELPGYRYHHDVIEKEDGNLIVAVDLESAQTIEDHVVELDRASGSIVRVWDFRTILDPLRDTYHDPGDNDWLHMNAVWWDEDDEALIVSGRNQSTVAKVTRDGELVWILSPHRGWGVNPEGTDLSAFLLTAVDAEGTPYDADVQNGDVDAPDFRWPWGQHASMLLPNGNLFVFDNGLNPHFTATPEGGGFSRGVEYEIDEQAMTIRQVWQYGQERGHEYYAPIISDVDHLPQTGHRLIMPGITDGFRAFVTEVTEEKDLIFEATVYFQNLFGSGALAWGEFDLIYRSERMEIYPPGL